MRWTEQPAVLPVQPLQALAERAPWLVAPLQAVDAADGLLVGVDVAAADAVRRHLGQRDDEQGGLLLGEVFAAAGDPARCRAVRVTRAVPAQDFASTGISLRMASDVWGVARRYQAAAELVVGWYHSHPGLGAFFSDTDRRTQRAFFPHAYSVGWVVDPLRGETAWFVGAAAEPPARVVYGVDVAGGACGEGGGAALAGGVGWYAGGPTTSTRSTK